MKKRYLVLIICSVTLAYLCFYPVSMDPANWTPPTNLGFKGTFQQNQKLESIQYLFANQCHKCEDVAIDKNGNIYGGSEEGDLIQFSPSGQRKVLFNTNGRPLGLDFDSLGNLYIADADKGLLLFDKSKQLTTLSTECNGRKFAFVDDLEVGTDGQIYFSDASWKFPIAQYKLDLLEHRPNGRLLSYNPKTKKTSLLLDDLYFANGIAVAKDGSFVLVNETGKYRVTRYWLKGPQKGKHDILIDNLPGFPDGISRGENGIFWIAFTSPRQKNLDGIMPYPFLRKMVVRLPDFLQPKPIDYSFVIGIDSKGTVKYNLQDPKGKFAQITSVQQIGSDLYFGSLGENGIGRFKLN